MDRIVTKHFGLIFVGLLLCSLPTVQAQPDLPVGRPAVPRLNGQIINALAGKPSLQFEEEKAGGASLKTDPELEGILETAERYRADGNFRLATKLWQAVLQRSGDTLYSSDGKTYRSLVRQVEAILAGLPAEGRQIYRIDADANAKEILAAATPESETSALGQVVRQNFLSSDGDDAAFRLAAIYMDNYDFNGARRLLQKIVDIYPDPSVPMDEVYNRLALCAAFLGDIEKAKQALAQSEEIRSGFDPLRNQIAQSVGKLAIEDLTFVANGWRMPHANVKRSGLMPSLPADAVSQPLVAKWQFYFEPKEHFRNFADTKGVTLVGEKLLTKGAQGTATSTEKNQQKRWRENNWRPAGHLILDESNLYFKTGADVVKWQLADIEAAVVAGSAEQLKPDWRSLWQNSFRADAATLLWRGIRNNYSSYGRRRGISFGNEPVTDVDVQIFGDQIYQRMALLDDVLYTIEGDRFDGVNQHPEQNNRNTPWNAVFRRARENYLTAYDAESGRALWRLPRDEALEDENKPENKEFLTSGGFMAAPLKFGEWLLLPVNEGGAISVCAIDPKNKGKTIWKSFLCDEPESSSAPQSPITMTLDGSDLFVNCGVGVMFVVDPVTGMIRFAKRYQRNGTVDKITRQIRPNPKTNFDGWSEDLLIPYGQQMICFASDNNLIHAYDRNSGETIWYMDRETHYGLKVDYYLGIHDDVLYAAGPQTIIAIDLKAEGSLLWGGDNLFDENTSYGRGMLTRDGIYVPVGNSIYRFGLKSEKFEPKLISKTSVDLGTDAPLGNLFSDGKRIWVHGGNRLYGLWPDDRDPAPEASEPDAEESDKEKDQTD